jgi:MFS transporter, DHA1 family, multidrug resistance protein
MLVLRPQSHIADDVPPHSPAHSGTSIVPDDNSEESTVRCEGERDEASFKDCNSSSSLQDLPPRGSNTPLPFLPKPNDDPNVVTWDGPDDPSNPQNWSVRYRWWITTVCIAMTLNVCAPLHSDTHLGTSSLTDLVRSTFASSAPSSALGIIADEFHVGAEMGDLILSLFLLGYTLGPIFWGPGSELIGRRPIFIGTLATYTLFHIGQARANNMTTLLVTRFLCGFFAVAPLTNSTGVIADIWDPVNRGIATSVFASAVFLGPVLGPVVGGLWVSSLVSRGCRLTSIIYSAAVSRLAPSAGAGCSG